MWPFGCIVDMLSRVVIARVHENFKKSPVNIGLQGFLLLPSVIVLPEVVWRQVATLVVVPAVVAHAMQDQVKN
jgi:hypothetical protein